MTKRLTDDEIARIRALDGQGWSRIRAEACRVLATKLDSIRASDSVSAASAAPGVARELGDLVGTLGLAKSNDAVDEIVARRKARLDARARAAEWKTD
jgi:hypothetical protein